MSANPFAPDVLHAQIQKVLDSPDVTIPDGHTHAFVTNYDGTQVQAYYVQKVNSIWTVQAGAAWHGGRPDIGVQAHATW